MFGHLPAYINFKKTNPEPFGDHNHTMVGTMAGTPSLAAAPGGAADATAPSAGSVPPPLGVPQPGGGRDGASPVPSKDRETEPAHTVTPKRASHAKVRWTLHRIDTNADSNGALACQSLTSAFDALVELELPNARTEVNTDHVDDEAELDAAFEDDELETRRQRSLAAAKDVFQDAAGSEVAEEASGWIDANSNAIVERGEHYYRQARKGAISPFPPSPLWRTQRHQLMPLSSAHIRIAICIFNLR